MSVLPSGAEWTPSSTVNTPDAGFIMFFQNATKDHKSVLLKQKEDIGYLSRHLDHVIRFAELATARNQSMAFLHCKRLVRLPRSFISSVESWHNSVAKWGNIVLTHGCLNPKIIHILPSVADYVSDGKPPTDKVQDIICATEHHTLSGAILFHH